MEGLSKVVDARDLVIQGPSVRHGCVHGRFQPPHLGHLEYLLAAKARCGHLWIGLVTPPSPGLPRCFADRQAPASNPLTHEERVDLWTAILSAHQVPRAQFRFVGFPIDTPEFLPQAVPRSVKCFVTVYEDWNRRKVEIFGRLGYSVEVLYERAAAEKIYSGTVIRESLERGDAEWKELVPKVIISRLEALALGERIRSASERTDKAPGECR